MHALWVPSVVPYKALEKFSKALYGTTVGAYSPRVFPSCHDLVQRNKTKPGEINRTNLKGYYTDIFSKL